MGEKRNASKTESGLQQLIGDTLDVSGTTILRAPLQVNTVNTGLVTATVASIGDVFTSGKVEATGDITAKNFYTYSDGTAASGNIGAKNITADTLLSCTSFDCTNNAAARNFIGGANGGFKLRLSDTPTGLSRISTQENVGDTDSSRIFLYGSSHATSPGIIQYTTKAGQQHVFEGGLVTSQAGYTMPSTGFAYFGRYVQSGYYGGGAAKVSFTFPIPYPVGTPLNAITVTLSVQRGNVGAVTGDDSVVYSHGVNNITRTGFSVLKTFYNFSTNTGGLDINSGFYWIATASGLY